MKKAIKIISLTLVLLLALMLVLPIAFKGKIVSELEKQTAKYLRANMVIGDINLSLFRSFPDMNVQVDQFSLSGVDKFEKDTLIGFDRLSVDMNLMSVIFGSEMQIKSIELDNPRVLAKVLADNSANWDIMKADTTATEEIDNEDVTDESSFKLALQNVEIHHGTLIYDDATFDFRYEMSNFDYLLSGDMTLSQAELKNTVTHATISAIMDGIPYLNNAKVEMKSLILADLDHFKFTFKESTGTINEIQLAFHGFFAMPADDIDMDITYTTKNTAFKSALSMIPAFYMSDFEGLNAAGEFDLNGFVKGIYNDNSLPAFGIDLAVRNGFIQYPDLPKSIDRISMNMKMENKGGAGDDNIIDLKQFHIEMAGNPFDADAYVLTSKNDVVINSTVKGKINLGSINQIVPLDSMTLAGLLDANLELEGKISDLKKENYDAFKAVGELKLDDFEFSMRDLPTKIVIPVAQMLFSPQYVDLQSFDMKLGRSDFQLIGRMDNLLAFILKDETLKARFSYKSNLIDANEFFSSEETAPDATETEQTTDTSAMEAPIIPKNIDFVLNTSIGKLLYDNLAIENISGNILLKNGNARLDKVLMNMLKGAITASGSYKTENPDVPSSNFDLAIQNIDIPETFKTFNTVQKLAPIARNATGFISMDMKIATNLSKDMSPVYETVNGEGKLKSDNISITNSTMFGKIADATKMEQWRSPGLSNIDLKFTIENGEIKIEPTTFNIAKTPVDFEGISKLNSEIDFQIGTQMPGNLAENINNKLPENFKSDANIDIQMFIGGTVTDPKIEKITSSAFTAAKDEVKKILSEAAKAFLAESQKRADTVMKNAQQKANEIKQKANNAALKLNNTAEAKNKQLIEEAKKRQKQLHDEAVKQSQKLMNEAKNPIAKQLAKKSGEKLVQVANESGKKLVVEAKNKGQQLKNIAKKEGETLKTTANNTARKILEEAQKTSENIMEKANKKAEKM